MPVFYHVPAIFITVLWLKPKKSYSRWRYFIIRFCFYNQILLKKTRALLIFNLYFLSLTSFQIFPHSLKEQKLQYYNIFCEFFTCNNYDYLWYQSTLKKQNLENDYSLDHSVTIWLKWKQYLYFFLPKHLLKQIP